MTKTEAKWLKNTYYPQREAQVNKQTIEMFTRAINIMKGTNHGVPACSCQWRTNALIAKSLYEQNQSLIEQKTNG